MKSMNTQKRLKKKDYRAREFYNSLMLWTFNNRCLTLYFKVSDKSTLTMYENELL